MMKAVTFPEANINLAENQDEYNTLPAYCDVDENKQPVQVDGKDRDPYGEMTVCFEADLTDAEIKDILLTRKIKVWYTGLTFGQGFQPMIMTTNNPFKTPNDNA
jgi:hypothetical protein